VVSQLGKRSGSNDAFLAHKDTFCGVVNELRRLQDSLQLVDNYRRHEDELLYAAARLKSGCGEGLTGIGVAI